MTLYAGLPPEINSGRMYTGPGAGPLLAAAQAWDVVAVELQSSAASWSSVIASLSTGPWVGPSSAAMVAAVAPYLAWMASTAAQAAQTASQATAAAAAYQAAFAAHVPPEAIAANRSALVTLAATNLVGQNAAAIAALETDYSEMWAQDAAAMAGYAGSSAAASELTPFEPPPQTVTGNRLADQLLGGRYSASTPMSELLKSLAELSTDYTATVTKLLNDLGGSAGASTFTQLYNAVKVPLGFSTQFNDVGLMVNFPLSQFLKFGPHSAAALGELPKDALQGGLAAPHWGRGWLTGAVSADPTANLGRGTLVGSLTVPPSWAANTPGIRSLAAALSAAGATAVPATELGRGSLLSAVSLAGMTGSAMGAGVPAALQRPGARSRLTPVRDLSDVKSTEKLHRLLARISEEPDHVQHHTVDQDGLDQLLQQLAKRPGVHAVHLTKGTRSAVLPPDAQLG